MDVGDSNVYTAEVCVCSVGASSTVFQGDLLSYIHYCPFHIPITLCSVETWATSLSFPIIKGYSLWWWGSGVLVVYLLGRDSLLVGGYAMALLLACVGGVMLSLSFLELVPQVHLVFSLINDRTRPWIVSWTPHVSWHCTC
jgi:hypothetical protein